MSRDLGTRARRTGGRATEREAAERDAAGEATDEEPADQEDEDGADQEEGEPEAEPAAAGPTGRGSPPPGAPGLSWAGRLYLGQAGVRITEWRRKLFLITGAVALVAIASIAFRGFDLGIEFVGGNQFQVPTSVGTLLEVEDAVAATGANVVSGQEIGGGDPQYLIRTSELSQDETAQVVNSLAAEFGISVDDISDDRVSAAWGGQITTKALQALGVFLLLVIIYLVIRFELRVAIAAVTALMMDLVVTAGVYSLIGFEVTPATVIGFLTIMGFDLYDTVVVFDKVHENTKGVTTGNTQTYGEAADLAVNQVMMRSINTSVVALLPVGGLLFIGAGLLGAGTLKDLGLVLFVGMTVSFCTSLFVAAPLMIEMKQRQPRIHAHTQRVQAKRVALANREAARRARGLGADPESAAGLASAPAPAPLLDPELVDLAGAAPKVGARPRRGRRGGGGGRRRTGGGGKRR